MEQEEREPRYSLFISLYLVESFPLIIDICTFVFIIDYIFSLK